jgi:hypothetical protein
MTNVAEWRIDVTALAIGIPQRDLTAGQPAQPLLIAQLSFQTAA